MTIRDIAREAGYAVGTVSRVLNNGPNVSEAARKRILEVVQRHNFQPNANARQLKLQASSGIAIVVKGIQNMLFTGILEKMQQQIEARGYISMLYYLDEEADEMAQARRICQERKPYGIAFLGASLEHISREIADLQVPCVLVTNGASGQGSANLSSVCVDDTAAAAQMIRYLYSKGHCHIGLIGSNPSYSQPSAARLAGCRQAFAALNLPFDFDRQYAYARYSMESGYSAMEWLLAHAPETTAVFALSDLMAVGAMRALADRGLEIPRDISVAGYDGVSLGRFCIPRLTTIRQNDALLAARSVEILLQCVEQHCGATHEVLPFELLEGESVGPAGELPALSKIG